MLRRFFRILFRYALLCVALNAIAVWWVTRRGDMGIGEALPTGIFGGTVLTLVVIATLRSMRRRTEPK